MSRDEIFDGIRELLRTRLDVQVPVRLETDLLGELGLDSLGQLTLIVELENRFRVCFERGEIEDIVVVKDIVDAVSRCLEEEQEAVHV